MRLPVVPQISTKDGTSNKNARLTNTLKESKKGGDKAVIRPGLVESTTFSGLGSGLIAFDGRVLTIVDDTVYLEEYQWMDLDAEDWNVATAYSAGDFVWYGGSLWGALGANTGQTPFLNSTHWETIIAIYDWDGSETYAIGDRVLYDDGGGVVVYYSLAPSNTNNNPSTSPQWSTSAPGTSRYRVNVNLIAALNATTPGPECASKAAAASAWYGTATTFKSCATKVSNSWVTYAGVETRNVFGTPTTFVRVTQFSDPTPFDCSGTPFNGGTIDGGKVAQTV